MSLEAPRAEPEAPPLTLSSETRQYDIRVCPDTACCPAFTLDRYTHHHGQRYLAEAILV